MRRTREKTSGGNPSLPLLTIPARSPIETSQSLTVLDVRSFREVLTRLYVYFNATGNTGICTANFHAVERKFITRPCGFLQTDLWPHWTSVFEERFHPNVYVVNIAQRVNNAL